MHIPRHVVLLNLLLLSPVERELQTLPEHPSSPHVFSGAGVSQSLVLCVCFVNHLCLSFCCFSYGNCVVCPSSIMYLD